MNLTVNILKRGMRAWLLCCLSLFSCAGTAAQGHILLLLSEARAPYQNFRQAFGQNLPPGVRLEVRDLTQPEVEPAQADLLVTVGAKAAQWAVANARGPVLATLLTSQDFARIQAAPRAPKQFSALYLDQPLPRQVALVRAALPARTRVGVLHTEGGTFSPEPLRRELQQQGAELITLVLRQEDSLAAHLNALLAQSEVLLAIPDSGIYNASTIRNILLSTYHRSIPLIGLSAAYVNAGALCAVFSTPEQQAAQSVGMAITYLNTGHLPPAQFPQLYEIALNTAVARSLHINIRSIEALRIEIDRATTGRNR